MDTLKQKIQKFGIVKTESVLDVSQFLNMQVDPQLMNAIGEMFAEYYKSYDFNAFITVESSGIAPALMASLHAKKPLIIIKKSSKLLANCLQQPCFSFTKNQDYYLTVQAEFIKEQRLILIDDFLATGNVVFNIEALLSQVNAELVATGIVISKNFQPGFQQLAATGKDIYSLAKIKKLLPETNEIIFA